MRVEQRPGVVAGSGGHTVDGMADADEIKEDLDDLPGRSKAEFGASIASAAISSVPIVGGAAAELFEFVLAPSLERRRDEWLRQLGQAVEELRQRMEDFDPRDLENNEAFVSAVLAASTVAVKTHQQEKLEMLRNAIVNTVLPGAPDEYEQMRFLRYIDELTPLHVRVLSFLEEPAEWFDDRGIEKPNFMAAGLSAMLELGLPELKDRRTIYDRVVAELDALGLSGAASALHTTMTNSGVWSSRITELGMAFLAFITLDPAAGDP